MLIFDFLAFLFERLSNLMHYPITTIVVIIVIGIIIFLRRQSHTPNPIRASERSNIVASPDLPPSSVIITEAPSLLLREAARTPEPTYMEMARSEHDPDRIARLEERDKQANEQLRKLTIEQALRNKREGRDA